MRPTNLKTKIFLDSGDPEETKQAVQILGFLDGQTTNPTLISKHPTVKDRIEKGDLFSAEEALGLYKQVVQEIGNIIPHGAISIEVYADSTTTKEDMLVQADGFTDWIAHPHIKFPITTSGLAAAEQAVADGMNVNMTLCFSQDQAAAVYAATYGAKPGQVFLSPFIGRLDDQGFSGLDLIHHILEMYLESDHHVQVLAASIRTVDHLVSAIEMGADCLTAPLNLLSQWATLGFPMQISEEKKQQSQSLHPIEFSSIDLSKPWKEYNIQHELTAVGLEKFVKDWNSLIQ